MWVKETNFSLFYSALGDLTSQICVAWPTILKSRFRATDEISMVLLRLNLYSIDLLSTFQVWVVFEVIIELS